MTKFASDSIMDAALTYVIDNSKRCGLYTAAPASLAQCTASTYLVSATVSTASFTLGNSSVSGRKIDVAAISTIPVTSTGIPTHLALFSSAAGSSGMHYITETSTSAITSTANNVTLGAWIIAIADPT